MERTTTGIFMLLIACFIFLNCAPGPTIDIWYGKKQHFGRNGKPQKWINVLGRVSSPNGIKSLYYALNGEELVPLSIGPDGRRLANEGDFNIEVDFTDLKPGKNIVQIIARDSSNRKHKVKVKVFAHQSKGCPLPYSIDWASVDHIGEVAQVIDGRWRLSWDGVKVLEPYYDRVIGFGDMSWRNYEVTVAVTFHGMRVPNPALDGGAGVIHAAIAVRWPGHDDDNRQPRVKWYPLGATAEFRLEPQLMNCSWRILGGAKQVVEQASKRNIEYEVQYIMKHRVETLADSSTQYSVKLWQADMPEPENWDLQAIEGADDVQAGAALIIAHYTEVTFGNVRVESLKSFDRQH